MFKSLTLLLGFSTSVYGAVLQPGGNFTQGPYTLYNYISTSTGLTDHSVSAVPSAVGKTPLTSSTSGFSEEFDASTSSVLYHYSTSTENIVSSSSVVSTTPAFTSLSVQTPANFIEHLSVPSTTPQSSITITTRQLVPSSVSSGHPATITTPVAVDPFHGVKENNGMDYAQGKVTTFTSVGTKYVLEIFPTYTITLTTESGESTYTYNTYSVFTKLRVSKHVSYDDSVDNTYTETSTLSTYYGGYWSTETTTSAVVTTYEPLVYRLESKVISALASWQSVISVSGEYLSTVKLGPISTDPGLYLTTVEVTERHGVSLDGVAIYYTVAVPKLVTFTLAAYTDYYTDTYYSTSSIEARRFSTWIRTIISVIDGKTETAYVAPVVTTLPDGESETVPFTVWYHGGFGIIATPLAFPSQQRTSATMSEPNTVTTSAVPVQSATDVPLTTPATPSTFTTFNTPTTSSSSAMFATPTTSSTSTIPTTSSVSSVSTTSTTSTTPNTPSTSSTSSQSVSVMRMGTSVPVPYVPEEDTTSSEFSEFTTFTTLTTPTTSSTSSTSSTPSSSSQPVSVMRIDTFTTSLYVPSEDTTSSATSASITPSTSIISEGIRYGSSTVRSHSWVVLSSNSELVNSRVSSPTTSFSSASVDFSGTSDSPSDTVYSESTAADDNRVSIGTSNSQGIASTSVATAAGGHYDHAVVSVIMRSGNEIVTQTSVVSETSVSTPGIVTGGGKITPLVQSLPSSTDYMGLLTHFTGGATRTSGGTLKVVGGILAVLLLL